MVTAASGNYPIERRCGEIERLDLQAAAMAADAAIMLDRIGVAAGWRCLDLGCGPGGITDLLAARVGREGRVVGLDADPIFLEHARARAPGNVEFVQGNAYRADFPDRSFDLVHMRFVAGTAGRPEALIAEAIRLAAPGGIVALQEADIASLACHPSHPAWDRLRSALEDLFAAVGDPHLGRRLFSLVRAGGLADVQYRPFLLGVRSPDPMRDYLPCTIESVRAAIVERGLMSSAEIDATLADCRRHLCQPDTTFTTYTVAQVWGRRPIDANANAARSG
jgi:SAM-dependent methyltransferase